ncbi:hypothetical protein BG004_006773 [Podila humilis]|nr:hypothetical protein BG004_006773 [Podila humilis]
MTTPAPAPSPATALAPSDVKFMILFGMLGAGKSSIANMLTQGDLFRENTSQISDAATEGTRSIVTLRGEGWAVTDTVGLLEDDEESDGTSARALGQLDEYLRTNRQGFHYLAYVMSCGDIKVRNHKRLFDIFSHYFESTEDNFVVIVTHCKDSKWIKEKQRVLRDIFNETPIIACDFPYDKDTPRNDRPGRKIGREMLVRDLSNLRNQKRVQPLISLETPKEQDLREKFEGPLNEKSPGGFKKMFGMLRKGSSTKSTRT